MTDIPWNETASLCLVDGDTTTEVDRGTLNRMIYLAIKAPPGPEEKVRIIFKLDGEVGDIGMDVIEEWAVHDDRPRLPLDG